MQRSTMSCNSVCRRRRKLSSHVRGERGRSSFSMVDSEDSEDSSDLGYLNSEDRSRSSDGQAGICYT